MRSGRVSAVFANEDEAREVAARGGSRSEEKQNVSAESSFGASETTADRALDVLPEESARDASHPIGQLRVEIASCASLLNNDVGGKSDPFVTLSVGAFKCKSRVVRKNLNPVWMQTFDVPFQWDGGVPPALNVLVEDWDFGSSPDFLGKCQVQPISLPKCAPDGAAPAATERLPAGRPRREKSEERSSG